jgi:D-hydroxyproline dehydrogenase subunit alpha
MRMCPIPVRLYPDWRAAKLQTRCGMGSGQGRVCGPAIRFLFKRNPDSVRSPTFPARVEGLAMSVSGPELEHRETAGGYQ